MSIEQQFFFFFVIEDSVVQHHKLEGVFNLAVVESGIDEVHSCRKNKLNKTDAVWFFLL